MNRNSSIWKAVDWTVVFIYLGLCIFGWLNIYGASYNFDQTNFFDLDNRAGKQFMWICISMLVGVILLAIDLRMYSTLAYILYGIMLLVLLATPFFAHDIKGSLSWISMGPISLQPAEFAKCFTALAIAKFMSRYEYHLRSWRDLIVPFILMGVPMFIIMVMQKETGSALVFASFLLMFYRKGMSGYVLLTGVAMVTLFIIVIRFGMVALPLGTGDLGMVLSILMMIAILLFIMIKEQNDTRNALYIFTGVVGIYAIAMVLNIWLPIDFNIVSYIALGAALIYYIVIMLVRWHFKQLLIVVFLLLGVCYSLTCNIVFDKVLQPHQRTRIEILLGLKEDAAGAGYNVSQSLIAIGSGQFFGKGYLQGTQTKLRFVPEQDTDFIFCTVGEEWGFIGATAVLLVFLWFIMRLLMIAERQRDTFSQIYAYCVVGIFLFHLTINVGMVLGLLPVIGIPLPFFSYGGSSLFGFTLLLFILLRLDASRIEKMR